ncbi:MAG: S-layer homology domain-containing protein [Bacillota bacterium]
MRRTVVRLTCLAIALCLVGMVPGQVLAAPKWARAQLEEQAMNALGKKVSAHADWNMAPWAVENLARSLAKGIVRGYEDGLYRPNQAVKQAEALVMVIRALGLEKDALELAKEYEPILPNGVQKRGQVPSKWVPYLGKIQPPVAWALGHILLAIDRDWVSADELQPTAAAGRAWVAMVLVRALGLEDQAKELSNASLSFSDASAIPDDKVGYVAVAVKQGWFSGYPDNTFQPQKAVTRAELATILDRLHESEGIELEEIEVKGIVVSVEGSKVKLQRGTDGEVREFSVSPDALVVVNREVASLAQVKPGSSVQLFLNGSGVAVVVICSSKGSTTRTQEVIEGEIAEITRDSAGWKVTVRLDNGSTRQVRLQEGAFPSPETLRVRDRVRVRLREGLGVEVVLLSAQEIRGRIVNIVTTQEQVRLTVRTQENNEVTYALGSGARITYNGQALTPDQLVPGDSVVLTIEDGTIEQVEVTARE